MQVTHPEVAVSFVALVTLLLNAVNARCCFQCPRLSSTTLRPQSLTTNRIMVDIGSHLTKKVYCSICQAKLLSHPEISKSHCKWDFTGNIFDSVRTLTFLCAAAS